MNRTRVQQELFRCRKSLRYFFHLERKAPASQLPCWEGGSEHGRWVPPSSPNQENRRSALVTTCFLLIRSLGRKVIWASLVGGIKDVFWFWPGGGRHHLCFHVTFFVVAQTLLFVIVPSPRPEKLHRMRFQYALLKLPVAREAQHTRWSEGVVRAEQPVQNHSAMESSSMGAELVPTFDCSFSIRRSNLSQPQHSRDGYYNLLLGIKIPCTIICSSSLFIPGFRKAK